ncbi:MAG: CBS domain-containing protein [Candidatus Methanomethyliaceae archaeon]|nr:CBS domain-containing protein [Candidatus Methanomethyliaceae archaeon]MDW7970955.1 CBS domain-containing protein [Nitrososphaerota archaeon]
MKRVRTAIRVEDVMTRDLVTLPESSSARDVAIAMSGKRIGSVIIVHEGNPVGIITERDLIERVLAKGLDPDKVISKDIMSSPLFVIDPKVGIMEAARKMASLNIRRLIVVDRGKMVGIITSSDILSAAPEMIEILMESAREILTPERKELEVMAGYCDNCEEWSDSLKEVNGQFLCEDCRAEYDQ